MTVALGFLIWASLGYAGWYVQIKRIRSSYAAYDAMMIGPMMLLGPLGLLIALGK